ncbi:MAG: 3-hydroxyacyl-ACP dehydratase FabZ [Paenibacillaceae bacterium]|nr:3-hydroxyacyl-ACP dehydratase FabZ [Paenibacillaceae bacterium]
MLDATAIMRIIPHRPPFLLIDRIEELDPGVRAVGMKAVTINEYFFTGHFPGAPIMPGVLIVEALAQVGAVALLSMEAHRDDLALFAGLDGVRFRSTVVPGDVLHLEVHIVKKKGSIGKGTALARVGERVAVEAQLLFALQPRTAEVARVKEGE